MRKNIYCRNLDRQAEVFTLVSNSKYCSVFRFTVVLNENVDKNKILEAYKLTLEKYQALKVKLKFGVFKYKLEINENEPLVFEENKEPIIKKINTKENNDYLIKVTFCKNEIYFDFYHALTDGNIGSLFVKECISRYLELKYSNKMKKEYLNDKNIILNSKDAYEENYKKFDKISYPFSEGYRITGKSIPNGEIDINHIEINIESLKKKSKEYESTISMYLTALIGYSIYKLNKKENKTYKENIKPINLCVPISLSKYFETDTLSNFFSHMIISIELKNDKEYTFEQMLKEVKNQFEEKLKLEKIMGVVSGNLSKMDNKILKIIPLFIKKLAFVLGSLKMKREFSMTVSNIGKIEFDKKFDKYVSKSYVTLSCDWAERVKCGISSYKDNLTITFCKNIEENYFEEIFLNQLKTLKIDYNVFGNSKSLLKKGN